MIEKLTFRSFREEDRERIVRFANNRNVSKNLRDAFPFPYTEVDADFAITTFSNQDPPLIRAICIDDQFVGSIGLHPLEDIHRLNAELGYWLAEEYWGNGIITEAIRNTVNYCFENFDFTRLFATPFPYNVASHKALKKCGFVLEATIKDAMIKDGVVYDEAIYAVRRSDWENK